MRKVMQYSCWLAVCLSAELSAGCDQPFSPMQENDRYVFSMYGYFDASADTHWVRVTPIRDELFKETDAIDATVTLENRNSGESTILNDSLFEFRQDGSIWNFWTTMKLEPLQSYLLKAEKSDGEASQVEINITDDFSAPYVQTGGSADTIDFNMKDIETLVYVQTIYKIEGEVSGRTQIYSVSKLRHVIPTETGYRFLTNRNRDLNRILVHIREDFQVLHSQIFIAATGDSDWPDFPNMDPIIEALPDAASNVENGLGYVTGLISKTVPYKSCYDDSNNLIPCPLEQRMRASSTVLQD